MIIATQLESAPVSDTPFPHYAIEKLICRDDALAIAQEISEFLLPRWNDADASSIGRRNIMYDTSAYEAFIKNAPKARAIIDAIAPILPKIVYEKYQGYFDRKRIKLKDLFCRVDLSAAQSGYVRGPHLDRERNFAINFLYLNGPQDFGGSGGELNLMKPRAGSDVVTGDKFPDAEQLEVGRQIVPQPGLFAGFLRVNNSWHTVKPMLNNSKPRLFIFFGVNAEKDLWDGCLVQSEDRRQAFLAS